ncbi:hypothetical protein CWB97_06500, partial [Pseudoalteromonas citrea]
QSNDDILLNIKALLCSNSGLLQMKATPRVRKIALLGKFVYPELRLTNQFTYEQAQCLLWCSCALLM